MFYEISIYKDKKDSLLLIPTAEAEGGFGVEINKPIIMEKPYDNATIGEKVKECFEISKNEPIQSRKDFVKVHEVVTGIKSYSKFSKDRLSVGVLMDTEKCFTIVPFVRFRDGSYRVTTESKEKYPEIKLPLDATNEQIGEAIMDRFEALNVIQSNLNHFKY